MNDRRNPLSQFAATVPTPRDIAAFVAETVGDLPALTRNAGLRDLAYLLDLVIAEAEHRAEVGPLGNFDPG